MVLSVIVHNLSFVYYFIVGCSQFQYPVFSLIIAYVMT